MAPNDGVSAFALPLVKVYGEFAFISPEERQRFLDMSHEYLIESIQTQTEAVNYSTLSRKISLNFVHPVKEVIFVYTDSRDTESD